MPASASNKTSGLKPRRALHSFCVACQGGAAAYVASCPDKDCQLHALRLPPENTVTGQQNSPSQQNLAGQQNQATQAATEIPMPGAAQAATPQTPDPAQMSGPVQMPGQLPGPGQTLGPQPKNLPPDALACLRAIRRHCMICADGRQDVRACADKNCPLWSFRFGVTPETYRRVKDRFFKPKKLLLPGLVQKTEAR